MFVLFFILSVLIEILHSQRYNYQPPPDDHIENGRDHHTNKPSTPIQLVKTLSPTHRPTSLPTHTHTSSPTNIPTLLPTNTPTLSPTNIPTLSPTNTPILEPTNNPTPEEINGLLLIF